MSIDKTVRAWKDQHFRMDLPSQDQELLDQNPAGDFELSEIELAGIVGATTEKNQTSGCCSGSATASCGTCHVGTDGCCGS